jgi:OOP family OmpA-OmpF porin
MRGFQRIVVCAVGAALWGCASTPQPSPIQARVVTPAAGERLAVDQVVLVSDGSLSMAAEGKLPRERVLAEAFVAGMPAGAYQAGAFLFGGRERELTPLEPFQRGRLATWASSVGYLESSTPLAQVIRDAGDEVSEPARSAVVLFSDGRNSFGGTEPVLGAARRLASDYPGRLCFYTVQLGDDPEGRRLLEGLAGATGCGGFRTASALGDPAALQAFQREIFLEGAPRAAAPPPPAPPSDMCAGVLRLRGITFEFDRARIRSEDTVILDEALRQLQACPGKRVRVDGHTDSVGTDAYNQQLSQRRADAVRAYLVSKGLAPGRASTRGFGESQPVAPNTTEEGRALNRRVEFTFQD